MKNPVRVYAPLLLLVCAALLSACEPSITDPSLVDWDDREVFRRGLVRGERSALDDLPGASIYHIDFQISEDFGALQGHQEVRYTNQEDEPLQEIYFQLFPNHAGGASRVSNLQIDGQEVSSRYEYEDTALRVDLPELLGPGEQIVISLDFEVEVAWYIAGNYGLFGYFDDILALDEFYPVIPVYDDEGWNVEAPPPNHTGRPNVSRK